MKTYKSNINKISLKYNKSNILKAKICSSKDINSYLREFYSGDLYIYESMFLILLNRSNNTVGYAKISQGGTAGTVVDVKIIVKYAVDSLCSSVIICHNHPGGQLKPSQQDINITNKLKSALLYFDINFLDHIILTEDDYFSFSDNGML